MFKSELIKFTEILLISLSIISLFTAFQNPATGYESSIYTSTPLILWISVILGIIFGLIVSFYDNYFYKKHSISFNGIYLIYFNYIIVLSIFMIRGYYGWTLQGDPSDHIGIIKQILSISYIPKGLFYPIFHIFNAEIIMITGIDLNTAHKLIPLIFGAIYVIFIYMLFMCVFSIKRLAIVGSISVCILMNHGWYLNFTPNHLSNNFFPLILAILIKSIHNPTVSWRILALISVFLIPPFHPVPTLALLIIVLSFFSINITTKLSRYTAKLSFNFPINYKLNKVTITLYLILFIWGITWISSFAVWDAAIHNINRVFSENGPNHLSTLVEDVNYAQGYGYNILDQILKVEGATIIYILSSFFALPFLINDLKKGVNNTVYHLIYFLIPLFSLLLITSILFLFNLSFGPSRMIIYTLIISQLFFVYILDRIIQITLKREHRYVFWTLILVFLVGIFLIGMLNLYPSPYLLSSNPQNTQSEIQSWVWLLYHKEPNIEISGITISPYAISSSLLIPAEQRKLKIFYKKDKVAAPYHFGYNNNRTIADSYINDVYLLLGKRDLLLYKDVLPEIAALRWQAMDFKKLELDWRVNKLYTNAEMDIRYVHARELQRE